MASPNQQRRLLELLDKLDRLKRGDPQAEQDRNQRITSMDLAGMNGPEHRDIVTLHGNGLISSRHFMASPANSWSSEGIYSYELTTDGEEFLNSQRHLLEPGKTVEQAATSQTSRVFIIHGTDPNDYVSQVETVCRQNGLDPIRMMEHPTKVWACLTSSGTT